MKYVLLAVLLTLPMGVEARERYRLARDKSGSSSTKAEGEKAKKDSEEVKKASDEKKTKAGVRPPVTLKDALSRAEEIQKARDQRTGEKTRHTEVTFDELMDVQVRTQMNSHAISLSHFAITE